MYRAAAVLSLSSRRNLLKKSFVNTRPASQPFVVVVVVVVVGWAGKLLLLSCLW